ncbi:MAG TPA: ABC transporter substrate-binding protein [Myxococcales bacterium]|nr:ABC transporter substrate-binding protein [Myxococcales bacterium]
MAPNNPADRDARLSLATVLATSLLTTVHHYYRMGFFALLLGAAVVGIPLVTLLWFRRTRHPLALLGYALSSGWVIIGFGIIDGLWKSTLKIFLGNFLLADYAQYFSWAPIGSFPFEATGILASVTSLFAAYYTVRFLRAAHVPIGNLRRGVAAAVLVVLAAGGGVAFARRRPAPRREGDVVRIGVIAPKQGPAALLGSSFLKAVELARDELPKTKYRYELVIADTGTNAVQTRRAIQKLIGEEGVQAIVGGISLPGQVVKGYATYARIPHFCVCSVTSIGDGVYNFTNIPSPEDEAARWVEEAQSRGVRNVALLWQDYPSIDGHVNALRAEGEKRGLRISYAKRFAGTTTDFTAVIADARSSAPDLYFVEALSPALDIVGRQLRQAGIDNVASVVAPSVSAEPELFEGTWYTDSNIVDAGFKERFEKKYPGTRFATHMMPYAYDSFRLLVDAFESGEDPVAYVRARTAYDGTAGRVTRAPGSGNFRSRPAVWRIANGKPQLID